MSNAQPAAAAIVPVVLIILDGVGCRAPSPGMYGAGDLPMITLRSTLKERTHTQVQISLNRTASAFV